MRMIEGALSAKGWRFGLVVSEFNEFVTSRLQAAALDVLLKAGAAEEQIVIVRVPGAFEIPLVARQLAFSGRCDAVICLGAVIRGATPHFDYIAAEASRGIAQASLDSNMPVIFGVLTTDTVEQAIERAGSAERNRGADAARTAMKMVHVMKALNGRPRSMRSTRSQGVVRGRRAPSRTGRKRGQSA